MLPAPLQLPGVATRTLFFTHIAVLYDRTMEAYKLRIKFHKKGLFSALPGRIGVFALLPSLQCIIQKISLLNIGVCTIVKSRTTFRRTRPHGFTTFGR